MGTRWALLLLASGEVPACDAELLKPDFDCVAVRICDVEKGQARSELALAKDRRSRGLGLAQCFRRVGGVCEAKAEVVDSARSAVQFPALEGNHVVRTRA